MAKVIQSIRGMHDVLPGDSCQWQYFEQQVADLMRRYGYQEIRTPHVESTDLFCRSGPDLNICAVRVEGDMLIQFEAFAGLTFRF